MDGKGRRRRVQRLEGTRNHADMSKHRPQHRHTAVISRLETNPGAHWRPVVHRAVVMVAVVNAGAFEGRGLRVGDKKRRHEH